MGTRVDHRAHPLAVAATAALRAASEQEGA